jgi:hypothetical protein
MALDKLGNPRFQKQGDQSSEVVFDQTTHQLLMTMCKELRLMRIVLQEMADTHIEIDELDLGTEEL